MDSNSGYMALGRLDLILRQGREARSPYSKSHAKVAETVKEVPEEPAPESVTTEPVVSFPDIPFSPNLKLACLPDFQTSSGGVSPPEPAQVA